jgi:hypothetical protein
MYNESVTELSYDAAFAESYYRSERNFQRLMRVMLTLNIIMFFFCIACAVTFPAGWMVLVQCVCAFVQLWCGVHNADTLSKQSETVRGAKERMLSAQDRLITAQMWEAL